MTLPRRTFLTGMAAATVAGATPLIATSSVSHLDSSSLAKQIIALFKPLPGLKAVKIWAPKTDTAPQFLATLNPKLQLFVGSAFKAFVLCEALRLIDAPDVNRTLQVTELELDDTVWSLSSSVFNPPFLSGKVTERTTMDAMISHSDNTATDMMLKLVGPDVVRDFISEIGLQNSLIPDGTRAFFGYIFGAKNWKNLTYPELDALAKSDPPLAHPVVNSVQTMASTADDFISFYSRALPGEFFKNSATLGAFRAILSTADAISRVVPLGASAFMKGGSIDADPSHALCLPGGMFVNDRWVYFCFTINWEKAVETDPETVQAFALAVAQALDLLKQNLPS